MNDDQTKDYWIKAGLTESAANGVAKIKALDLGDKKKEAHAIASCLVLDAISNMRMRYAAPIGQHMALLVGPIVSMGKDV